MNYCRSAPRAGFAIAGIVISLFTLIGCEIQDLGLSGPSAVSEDEARSLLNSQSTVPANPPAWNANTLYNRAGIYVSHKGRVWVSRWYITRGAEPGANAWNGWKKAGPAPKVTKVSPDSPADPPRVIERQNPNPKVPGITGNPSPDIPGPTTNPKVPGVSKPSAGGWDGVITPRTPMDRGRPVVMGYFPSWTLGWIPDNGVTSLAKLPDHVNYVIFSFAKANLRYTKGSYDLSRTGIEADAAAGKRLALSIELLRSRGTKVILSIGGETYWREPANYTDIRYGEIKDLVDDYGFDGIDWDYEPQGSFDLMTQEPYRGYLISFIRESRKVMPKSENYLIMTAPPGVGVLGGSLAGQDSEFPGFRHADRIRYGGAHDQGGSSTNAAGLFNFTSTGSMIPILNAPGSVPGKKIGHDLDLVGYQSYNTGKSLNRTIMYDSWLKYAEKYGFALAHGTHVPHEPWGPHYEHTPSRTAAISDHIRRANSAGGRGDGVMIWQLLMKSNTSNHDGISYMKIASDVLQGRKAAANITDAGAPDFGVKPVLASKGRVGGGSGGSGRGGGSTPTVPPDKSLRPYDVNAVYGEGGYLVSYAGRVYRNMWWTSGDIPGSSASSGGPSPWEEVPGA